MALQLEALRGGLAQKAVLDERLRVARDTHDLLGLGLSAIALKADLMNRLLGRDNAGARTEMGELARICATARADVRLVIGEARDLPLEAELEAAREVLASAGVDVRISIAASRLPMRPPRSWCPCCEKGSPNVLRHSRASHCVIEMTARAGLLRLQMSNDGSIESVTEPGRPGHGLANLTARIGAAGGRLTGSRSAVGSILWPRFRLPRRRPGTRGRTGGWRVGKSLAAGYRAPRRSASGLARP